MSHSKFKSQLNDKTNMNDSVTNLFYSYVKTIVLEKICLRKVLTSTNSLFFALLFTSTLTQDLCISHNVEISLSNSLILSGTAMFVDMGKCVEYACNPCRIV